MRPATMRARDPYKFLVEGVREFALYLIGPSGKVQTWNEGAVRLHGFTAEEIVGQNHSRLFTEEDRASGAPEAELRMAEHEPIAHEPRWLVRKDGARFWSESTCSAVRDEQGKLIGFSKTTHDASDKKQLKQRLDRATDELARFAFVVSHDLQEPVRTMKSYGELLARRYKGRLDADADDFLSFMTGAADRMTQLLKDLLSFSQAGRADRTNPEPTQAATALQWAIMNVNSQVKECGAVVTYDPLPAVLADQTQLAQLFQHLLTNSLKFRGPEPPRIHVTAARRDERVRFSVKDNGIGVEKEFHDRIFGVFKRLHGKDVPGTGIGLSICRKIVEAQSGEIWIESEAGRGATFHFTLPAVD
jgi:PAS domain S-box-containing protein